MTVDDDWKPGSNNANLPEAKAGAAPSSAPVDRGTGSATGDSGGAGSGERPLDSGTAPGSTADGKDTNADLGGDGETGGETKIRLQTTEQDKGFSDTLNKFIESTHNTDLSPHQTVTLAAPQGSGTRAPDTSDDEKMEAYFPALTGNKRDATECKLRDMLLAQAGDPLRIDLTRIYTTDNVFGPGLHILVAPLPFALAAIAGRVGIPKDTPTIRVGKQIELAWTPDLRHLTERYRDDEVLAVVVDDAALKNGLFWQLNRDIDAVNAAALARGLAMVMLMSPGIRNRLDTDADLLDHIAAYERMVDPAPETAFEMLLEARGPVGAAQLAKSARLTAGSDTFAQAFAALREKDHKTLLALLKDKGLSEIEAEWRVVFDRAAINGRTREPAAAAALFIGANIPNLPRRLFAHIWVILHTRIQLEWTEPDIRHDRDDNPRSWREYQSDEALDEIGLIMRPAPEDGMRRAQFSTGVIARRYADWFASNAPRLNHMLSKDFFDVVRPLDLGTEVIESASALFARLLRDDLGTAASPADLARAFVNVIAGHRSEADRAIHLSRQQRRLHEIDEASVLDVIGAELSALERERHTDHLKDFAPRFVLRCLQEYRGDNDPEMQLDVIREIWNIAYRALKKEDDRIVDFWRQITTAMVYGIDPERGTAALGDLFGHDPRAFLTLGYGASRSLSHMALQTALSKSAAAFDAETGLARAWAFGTLTALSTLWMHLAANAPPDEDTPLATPQIAAAVGRVFLTRTGMKWLQGLSVLTRETAQSRGVGLDGMREGTLARSLAIAQLRLLYGFSGGDFDHLAAAIDGTSVRSTPGLRAHGRWTADSAKNFAAFDAWRCDAAAATGPAMIAGACVIAGGDPDTWVGYACDAAPDAARAARILHGGAEILRRQLRKADLAVKPDDNGKKTFIRTDKVLVGIMKASERRLSGS